jgi:6,7-dimethyl-8-ribityllumazine synthase
MNIYEGNLTAEGYRFAIVASRFNSLVVDRLVEGAVDCLVRHGAREENISLFRVPGSWEIPLTVRKVLDTGEYDAVIALGALIRGETPHFDYIANEVSKGLSVLALEKGKPVSFGIITAETLDQALERAGSKMGNKGWEAALSAIEMVNLLSSIG